MHPLLLALLLTATANEEVAVRSASIESRFGIRLAPSSAWTEADVEALEEELESLPPEFARPPGGVLVLQRHRESSAYGMGDGSAERPEWSEGLGVFHLYAVAPTNELRADRFTRSLSEDERLRLWRRRAIVHALVRRWDAEKHWSDESAFRRISGWLRAFERPLTWREQAQNVYAGAFSRTRGQASAALDLATFAEEALVPVEAVHPGLVPPDDAVRCQEFSKWRFLFRVLERDRLWPPNDARADRGACPAFEAWANPQTLSHAEVLFVAASGRAPESLFGHLLLRLVRKAGERVEGPSFGTAVQLVALTGADPPDLAYLARGLTGGYRMGVVTAPMAEIAHDTLESESRSIRRFRLALSPGEQERLLERIWEMERRGYLEYWFFSDNCGTALAFLLEGALDDGRHIELPPRLSPVLPSAVLDALSRAGLLVPEAPSFEAIRDRAARAEREREETAAVLRARLSADDRAEFEITHARLLDPHLAVRRTGWLRLEAWTTRVIPCADAPTRDALYAYWLSTVRIERYAVERAAAERRTVLLRSIDATKVTSASADQIVAARQQEFIRESELDRRLAVLDRIAMNESWLEKAPRRPLTSSEQATVDRAEELTQAFAQLTRAHGRVVDAAFAETDPAAFLDRERDARAQRELGWARAAQPASGYARFAAGAAVSEGRWLVAVRTAALDERWGDQRVDGFQPTSEIRVLSGDLLLAPRLSLPEVVRSDLTLIGYRTLQRELPTFRRTPFDSLGWGARLRWDADALRAQRDRTTIDGELYAVLDSTPDARRFTALGVGASAQARWTSGALEALRPLAGPQVAFAQRFALGRELADAVRVDARYRLGFGRGGAVHEVEAEAGIDLRARAGPRSFLLSPRATFAWEHDPRAAARRSFIVGLWVEPL